jgi:hypothetical protein
MVAQQQAFRRTFYQAIEHTDVLAISQAPTAALPSTNAAGRDTPTGSAMPELGLFAEAEIDTSPLFGALR